MPLAGNVIYSMRTDGNRSDPAGSSKPLEKIAISPHKPEESACASWAAGLGGEKANFEIECGRDISSAVSARRIDEVYDWKEWKKLERAKRIKCGIYSYKTENLRRYASGSIKVLTEVALRIYRRKARYR